MNDFLIQNIGNHYYKITNDSEYTCFVSWKPKKPKIKLRTFGCIPSKGFLLLEISQSLKDLVFSFE